VDAFLFSLSAGWSPPDIILRCGLWVDVYSSTLHFEQEPGRICRPYDGIPGEQNCKVELWDLSDEAGDAAQNMQRSLRNGGLRNFGATALDKYSQHDHEKHAGDNLDEGDTAHGNLLS